MKRAATASHSNLLRLLKLAVPPRIFLFALWTGCERPYTPDAWRIVTGVVVDKETREPLSSAWLALNDTTSIWAVTDTTGAFYLQVLSTQNRDLCDGKDGYMTACQSVENIAGDITGLFLNCRK